MFKTTTSKIITVLFILALISLTTWAYFIYMDRNDQPVLPSKTVTFQNDSSQSITSTDDLTNDNDTDNQNGPNDPMNNNPDLSAGPNDPMNSNLQPTTPKTDVKKNSSTISPTPTITGSKLANITPEHCNNDCQAFAIDLSLKEYCEEACGISPIKNVTDCDGKKDIQKDYCTKDLAITKNDISTCNDIKDANIKQTCKNIIEQKAIEDLKRSTPSAAPEF